MAGACAYWWLFSFSTTCWLMLETRPVRVANMAPRLLKSAVEMPGKLLWSSHAVLPVVAGSPVARPKEMPGMDSEPTDCCQVATDCQLPPKLNWCAPFTQESVS